VTRRRLIGGLSLAVALTAAAPAHETGTPLATPASWATTWDLAPAIVTSLFLSAALYSAGLRALRRQTGARTRLRREALLFSAGRTIMAVALVSPIHPLGEVLFSAHMTQHELLMVAAAPLLVLGRPGLVALWAFPRSVRPRLGGAVHAVRTVPLLNSPFVAWLIHALILWVWHVPRWFESSLDSDAIHAFQHACFLGSAVWFWHTVFHGPQRQAGYGMAVVYLFTTAVHTGALGALITFAGHPWYTRYAATAPRFGLSGAEDQQLGGLIMWVPGGLTYIVAALALFSTWLRERPGDSAGERARPGSVHPVTASPPCAPSL
jgi:cytochrome c oxidase assembly factor CtaG